MRAHLALMAVLLGCTTSATSPSDAAAPAPLELTSKESILVVTQGRTATIHVSVAPQLLQGEDAVLSIGGLPQGVSAPTATWHTTDTVPVALVLTATADAPLSETTIEVRASASGSIVGKATATLDVGGAKGALDPSFGDGGVVLLSPSTNTIAGGIALATDGSFIVAGATLDAPTQPFVAHVGADGTPGPLVAAPVAYASPIQWIYATAFAADGRVAIGVTMDGGQRSSVIVLDSNGQVLWGQAFGRSPCCLAWDGDALFAAEDDWLFRADLTSVTLTPTNLSPHALVVPAPGTVLVGGQDMSSHGAVVAKYLLGDTTASAVWSPTPVAPTLFALGLDGNGTVLLGTASLIQRYMPYGSLVSTFPAIPTPVAAVPYRFLPGPGGDTFVIGDVDSFGDDFIARFDTSTKLVPDFGTFGRVITSMPVAGAAFDAAGARICTTGSSPSTHAYVACYSL